MGRSPRGSGGGGSNTRFQDGAGFYQSELSERGWRKLGLSLTRRSPFAGLEVVAISREESERRFGKKMPWGANPADKLEPKESKLGLT